METKNKNQQNFSAEKAEKKPDTIGSKLLHIFVEHAFIKLLSICLAIILFLYAEFTSKITRAVAIQVIQPELPGELIFSREIPSFLNVKFYGKEENMDFDVSNFKVILENPKPIPGSNLYIATIQPTPPKNVEVIYTKELQLSIDRLSLRKLSVIPTLKLNLPENRELGYISIQPRTIILKGPHESLALMSHVVTEELNVEETDDLISRRVLITGLPDFVSFAANQPFQVELNINTLPVDKEDYKVIKNVRVLCINKIPGITMQIPGKSTVNIYITKNIKQPNRKTLKAAYVYCPVFFDKERKTLRPSFLIQNQPVFSVDASGSENTQVLKIDPSHISLQFEWAGNKSQTESNSPAP